MKFHRKMMNFDRKLGTPKCEILMCIYRKSECESERQKFDPNGPKIIDFELLFGRTTTASQGFREQSAPTEAAISASISSLLDETYTGCPIPVCFIFFEISFTSTSPRGC